MRVTTLNSAVTVPGGAKLLLTHAQAVAREGLLDVVDTKEIDKALAALASAKAARKAARDQDKDTSSADGKVEAARNALASRRGVYLAKVPVFFKGGEVLGFDGNPNGKELRDALGLPDQPSETDIAAIEAARNEGVAAGRAALLAEVAAYNAALDQLDDAQEAVATADAALEAETEPSKRGGLEKALAAARRAVTEAEAKAESLKPVA